jgi:hypothetical protein
MQNGFSIAFRAGECAKWCRILIAFAGDDRLTQTGQTQPQASPFPTCDTCRRKPSFSAKGILIAPVFAWADYTGQDGFYLGDVHSVKTGFIHDRILNNCRINWREFCLIG